MIIAYSIAISCNLMHIFCCGVPLIMTITGLATNFNLYSQNLLSSSVFENFERFELKVLIFSGLILLLSFILKLKAKKLNCCKENKINFCSKNEKINSIFLKVASILYIINLTTFTIEKLV
jgi:hypothetical protein